MGSNGKDKKADALKSFFPDLGGIPMLGAASNPNSNPNPNMPFAGTDSSSAQAGATAASSSDTDPSGPAKLSMAQLHFQKLLAQPQQVSTGLAATKLPMKTMETEQRATEIPAKGEEDGAGKKQKEKEKEKEKEKKSDSTEVKILTKGSLLPRDIQPAAASNATGVSSDAVTTFSHSKSLRYTVQSRPKGAYVPAETTQISLFEVKELTGDHVLSGGRRITANGEYICYATRTGLRVLHKGSVEKILLAAKDTVDAQFCPRNPSLLACVSSKGLGIYELRFVVDQHALQSRPVLTVRQAEAAQGKFSRVRWHPVQERLFVAVTGESLNFVMLSSKLWEKQQSSGGQGMRIEEARVREVATPGELVAAVDFDKSGEMMLTANYMKLKVWKVTLLEGSVDVTLLNAIVAHDGQLLSDAFFMGNSIVTCVDGNKTLRLWDLAPGGKIKTNAYQQLTLVSSTSAAKYIARPSPSNACIVLADTTQAGTLCLTLHPNPPAAFHQVTEFSVVHNNPTLSFDVVQEKAQRRGSITLYCLQSGGAETRALRLAEPSSTATSTSAPVPPSAAPLPPPPPPKMDSLLGATPKPIPPQPPKESSDKITPTPPPLAPLPAQPPAAEHTPAATPAPPPAPAPIPARSLQDTSATPGERGGMSELPMEEMKELFSRMEASAKLRAEKDTERQQLLLKVLSKSLNDIPDSVEETLLELLREQAFKSAVADAVTPAMAAVLKRNPSQSIDENKIAALLQPALASAFKQSVESALLPAFTAGCNNMASQFGRYLQSQGAVEAKSAAELTELRSKQEAMARQLDRMEAMLSKVLGLSEKAASGQPRARSGDEEAEGGSAKQHGLTAEQQVNYWIGQGDYENAFLSALHSNDASLLSSACKRIDSNKLFATRPVPLSSRTLLSLFHQLSFDLLSEPLIKLQWLKGIGLAMDKNDPTVSVHVPRIAGKVREALDRAEPVLSDPAHPAHNEYKMCRLVVNNL